MTVVVLEDCLRRKHTDGVERREPLPEHAAWRGVSGKLAQLDRNGA